MIKMTLVGLGIVALVASFKTQLLFGASQADVVLTGAAQTCFAGEPDPVGGVNISVFNVVNAAAIVAKLDTMDRFTGFADGDSTATSRFDAMETQLRSLVVGTPALARKISSANGSFSVTMAPISSVLVVGYHNTEDDPYAYAYKIMSGQSSTSFILDMSRGQCGY